MIFAIVMSIISPRRRRRYYRSYLYDDYYRNNSHTLDYLRMFIRRRRALSKAKKFIKRKRNNITLKNSNVMLIFDTKFKTFVLLDTKNTKKSATIIWAEQTIKMSNLTEYSEEVDTEMEKTFDKICRSFNEMSNYLGILVILKQKFTVIKENKQNEEIPKTIPSFQTEKQVQKEKININTLDEAALSKLPGISVILAKKIVNRMNLKGNFSYIEEFYDEMKIKPHFQKKLNELICVKPIERKKRSNDNDRIIDL